MQETAPAKLSQGFGSETFLSDGTGSFGYGLRVHFKLQLNWKCQNKTFMENASDDNKCEIEQGNICSMMVLNPWYINCAWIHRIAHIKHF